MPGSLFQSIFWSLHLSVGISGAAVQREPPHLNGPAVTLPLLLDSNPPISMNHTGTNTSALLPNNPSLGDVFDITCDGPRFGYIDDSEDCASALSMFAPTTVRVVTFAERRTAGMTADMYPLPWRWMGRHADCFFQPVLKPHAVVGSASLATMRHAAYHLVATCAERRGEGGIITNLGSGNRVVLTMGRYMPGGQAVRCGAEQRLVSRCREILSGMPVGIHAERFGLAEDADADVHVPYRISSVDESCSLTIYTTNRRGEFDTCSWFSLWEAANAVYYKCISINRRGFFGGLGSMHQLYIAFSGP